MIEKLGITPCPWKTNLFVAQVDAGELPICKMLWPTKERSEEETMNNENPIAAAPDMLEALITICFCIEQEDPNYPEPITYAPYLNMIDVIEKATGKSWDEIKELII